MKQQTQEGPWGDTIHGGPWTRHGHAIPGRTVLGERKPSSVVRCGGVALCRTCQADAAQTMTAADRPAAPGLSPAEAKRLDRPEAEEALRERVARALAGAAIGAAPLDEGEWYLHFDEIQRDDHLRLADAAIAVITTPVEGAPAAPDPAAAVARVEALIGAADERVRASVPASGAERLIANGEHAVKVRDLRAALAGDPS